MSSPADSGHGNGAAGTRALVVSIRRLNPHAAWCSNYEFEDVVRSVDDVDFLELEPAERFDLRQRVARTLAWRGWPMGLVPNPGVKPVTLRRDYDLLVFICMNVWDLLYLNAIRGWRERCRVKVCYMVELYAPVPKGFEPFVRLLSEFDHVALSFSGSVEATGQAMGKPCHHLSLAADVLRFTPYPQPPPRVIDVLSVGRRSEPTHQSLRRLAAGGGIFYVHDTIPGALVRPTNAVEHRTMLATSAKRSRLFIAYPAKFGDDENLGQSDVGARYFEGAAAGAVLFGRSPTAPAFRRDFPWSDAVVEVPGDGAGVAEIVTDLLARPAEIARLGARNAVHALRAHDWAHRWQGILKLADLPPRPALGKRLAALESLATQAEAQQEGS